jgi:F0F1-type ATP synthase assembly protein I
MRGPYEADNKPEGSSRTVGTHSINASTMNSIFDNDEGSEETAKPTSIGYVISLVPPPDDAEREPEGKKDEPSRSLTETSESTADSIRKSGLAYTAAIAFFASVVFMLVIGWGADLLFGSSPWGIVIGIVLGSIIGFVQFFRINSQIFGKEPKMGTGRMLISDDEDKTLE